MHLLMYVNRLGSSYLPVQAPLMMMACVLARARANRPSPRSIPSSACLVSPSHIILTFLLFADSNDEHPYQVHFLFTSDAEWSDDDGSTEMFTLSLIQSLSTRTLIPLGTTTSFSCGTGMDNDLAWPDTQCLS